MNVLCMDLVFFLNGILSDISAVSYCVLIA